MNQEGYPFYFVGVDATGSDEYLTDTLVYRFESVKSHHQYVVKIERYIEHLCCIKFFDETVDTVTGKFSQLSGTYEPRTIFRTVANIALDALRRDPSASFFFVGAADKRDQSRDTTRRYRVYSAYVKDLGIDKLFRPSFIESYSMCVLVNIRAVPDRQSYVQQILDFISL